LSTELLRWRSLADRRITPIEKIKTRVRSIREGLDQRFPNWKAAYDANPQDYLAHDARREYFVSLRVILQNAQLGFVYIRDHLTSEDWWRSHVDDLSESAVLQALREQALMIKFFSFHATAVSTEETCRAVVRAAPQVFAVDVGGPFHAISQRLLKVSTCQKYQDLFEVMRLIRNTIHTNGVYRPQKPENRQISYGGRTFTFEVGKTLDWMGDDFPEWAAEQLSVAMECIVSSQAVASVPLCSRGK
jgi:hypothetical protein